MDCPKPEDDNLNGGEAGCSDAENGPTAQCNASAPAVALPQANGQVQPQADGPADTRNESDYPAQDQDQAQVNSSDQTRSTPETGNGDQAIKLLQTMSQWLEGASCPSTDEALLTGWSARYAEQFDNDGAEEQVDLAPVLGLPEGTAKEEVVRVAFEQEEDLIQQLIS